jgi:hypothetical protein
MAKQAENKESPKMGRPSTYSQEIADIICKRLAEGESLRTIVKDEGMPAQGTVYVWLLKHKDFEEQYTRAREEQAETHADEIVSIADETPDTVPVYDKEGNLLRIDLSSAYLQWQRQRIDARKWNASKQRPKKYGDRQIHSGDDDSPVVVEHNLGVFGELLKAMKMERQAND